MGGISSLEFVHFRSDQQDDLRERVDMCCDGRDVLIYRGCHGGVAARQEVSADWLLRHVASKALTDYVLKFACLSHA
jgi:hypothetical protein